MNAAEKLLERLNRVQARGPGQWYASCPTEAHKHGDRSRGLSMKETSDGIVLVHCFAGCNVSEILAAVNRELSDLFPDRPEPRKSAGASVHRLSAREQIEIIKHESMVVAVAAASLLDGTAFEDDVIRVTEAVERIYRVTGESYGS